MAEREGDGLDILIKQRISRPSFTRMISWEIEKASNCPPKRHRTSSRQKKPDHSHVTDRLEENASEEKEDGGGMESEGDSNDSEDSEYFSAEENVPCTGQDESDETDDSDCTNPEEKVAVVGHTGNLLSAQLTNISLDTSSQHNRKAPSKKQKKKRRRQQHYHGVEHYAEFLVPFRNVENINFGVEELRRDLLNKSTDTVAEVPTLFELCIRTIWRKNQHTIAGFELLPGPIKHSVSSWRQRRAFASMQLSCLYCVLAVVEKEIKVFTDMLWFPTRNVWSLGPYLQHIMSPYVVGNEVSVVIPYNYASCAYSEIFTSGSSRSKTSNNYLFPLYTLSLLVNVLDLMIPTNLRTKKEKEALTGEDTDQAITAVVLTTLNHLKMRYPDVIKLCQDRALPYIYWLRGHNRLALGEFLRLAESATRCKEKTYNLLEAARLCRLQNQEDAARKLYREVQDLLIVLPGVWGIENVKSEIILQTLMLCANTYDQGQMSEQKAVESLKAWGLLNNVAALVELAQSFFPAVDALLCYHLAHLPGKTAAEKLSGLVDFLEIATTQCASLGLYLSLVYAWMGRRVESLKVYQGLMRFGGPPGYEFKPEAMRDTDYTPWYPVLDAVSAVGRTPPRPLQVVWRTQLGNLRVIKDMNVYEGDLSGRSLNLRISTDGHLTGDLHLLLPPVKAINFDLYTGRLVLPSSPGQTYVSKNVFDSIFHSEDTLDGTSVKFQNGPYAVTPTELYSDDQGRSVHLMAASGAGVLFAENTPVHIHWTNNQGQRCKLSIMKVLKKAVFEETKKLIQNTYSHDNVVAALKGLEYAFSNNLQMNLNQCLEIGTCLLHMGKPKAERKLYNWRKHGKMETRSELKSNYAHFLTQLQDFVSYGSILLLLGKCNMNRGYYDFFLLFDVSSKESFQNPVINLKLNNYDLHVKILGRQKHIVPHAHVLYVIPKEPSAHNLMIFGPDAKPVHDWNEGLDPPYDDGSFCILGNSLFRVQNPDRQNHPDQVPSLVEVRYGHEERKCTTVFHSLDYNLRQVKVIVDSLLLVCTDGLRVLCPTTMELQPLFQGPDSNCQLPFSEDGMVILVEDPHVSVLEEKSVTTSSGLPTRFVAVAVHNFLLMLAVQERSKLAHPIVEVVFCVRIAGHATEICFLSQTAGYLVSTTMHTESKEFYRETVYHLSPSGQLLGLLPCLGPGPREFCPIYLPPHRCSESENAEGGAELEGAVWHVYMRDGHEGIIAVRL